MNNGDEVQLGRMPMCMSRAQASGSEIIGSGGRTGAVFVAAKLTVLSCESAERSDRIATVCCCQA